MTGSGQGSEVSLHLTQPVPIRLLPRKPQRRCEGSSPACTALTLLRCPQKCHDRLKLAHSTLARRCWALRGEGRRGAGTQKPYGNCHEVGLRSIKRKVVTLYGIVGLVYIDPLIQRKRGCEKNKL